VGKHRIQTIEEDHNIAHEYLLFQDEEKSLLVNWINWVNFGDQNEQETIDLPHILRGASNSNNIGWLKKISRDL